MTPEELAAIRKKGEKCRAKGCKCLARCYHCWNRYWMEKADVCTHPNWCPPDGEPWLAPKPSPMFSPPTKTQPKKGKSR